MNRLILLIGLAVALIGATALGLSIGRVVLSSEGESAPPSHREVPIPTPLYTEMLGRQLTVVDHVLGVSDEGWLCYVVLVGTYDNGERYETAAPMERVERVISYPSDMIGARFKSESGESYVIDDIELALDADGHLAIFLLEASSDTGKKQSIASDPTLFGQGCCNSYFVAVGCQAYGDCSTSCVLPQGCSCTGDGACFSILGHKCRGGCGLGPNCSSGQCKAPSGPASCGCQ